MKSQTIGNIVLSYAAAEQETAGLVAAACERAISLAGELWGLGPPANCRVYVMTSWLGFVFQSAPWPWRLLLGSTMPVWAFRARRTWPYSAGWTLRYGKRVAIGVKPPRLLEGSDRSIGLRMFVEEKDMRVNVQHVTCHELVHACSAHLRLPMWLNEGIATFTVDRFLDRPVIREDTLAFLRDYEPKGPPPTYRQLSRMGQQAIAYQGVRGYWLTRYLEETLPGFLRRTFAQPQDAGTIEQEMAAKLGMAPESFWGQIDRVVEGHFAGRHGS